MSDKLRIRSEEIQEVLSLVPNWMIRWGNTMIFIIILGVLLISWCVKYPDTIHAEVTISSINPFENVYANSSGILDIVFIKNRDIIKQGAHLGIIENNANYNDVMLLKKIVGSIEIKRGNFHFPLEELPILFLGDIESDYTFFKDSYNEYLTKVNRSYSNTKKSSYNKSMEAVSADSLQKNTHELKYLHDNIQTKKNNLSSSSFKTVVYAFNRLKKAIKKWEFNYVLKSSVGGIVYSFADTTKTFKVNLSDMVFRIVPIKNNHFTGKVKVQAQNLRTIRHGQEVNIKLTNYPYNEFGLLKGSIKSLSSNPDIDGNYLVEINLPKKPITTYKKEIRLQHEMQGSAEIITKDLRLLERFFGRLMNVLNT